MSVVVIARHVGQGNDAGLTQARYKALLKAGLPAVSGKPNALAAIRSYFPGGVVGIKTNCIARKANSTPVALADALSELLVSGGIDENNVVVWDRTGRELEAAGYKLNASSFGRRCFGTDTGLVGYDQTFYSSGEVSSLVSRIMTEIVTHSINLPILKDHSIAGLSAGMKNMYGAINNPNKYHDNNCDPYVAHVNNLEPIRRKLRLSIIDAVKVQYHGGPGYVSRYVENYGSVIISSDPVAADRVALRVLDGIRKSHSLPSLAESGRPVHYLETAEKLGLGMADESKIELKVLTVEDDGSVSAGKLFG